VCWVSHSLGTSLERESGRRSVPDDDVMDTCLVGQELVAGVGYTNQVATAGATGFSLLCTD
jgi:hypothetical protein